MRGIQEVNEANEAGIEELRMQLDQLDDEIVKLFEDRDGRPYRRMQDP